MDSIVKLDTETRETLKIDVATIGAIVEGAFALSETIGADDDERDLAVCLTAFGRQWLRMRQRIDVLADEGCLPRAGDYAALLLDTEILGGLLRFAGHLHGRHCQQSYILAALARLGESLCERLDNHAIEARKALHEARTCEAEEVTQPC